MLAALLQISIYRLTENALPSSFNALDEISMDIRKSRRRYCGNHWKRYYAILVQYICDSNCKFLFMSIASERQTTRSNFPFNPLQQDLRREITERTLHFSLWSLCVQEKFITMPALCMADADPCYPGYKFYRYHTSLRIHIEKSI